MFDFLPRFLWHRKSRKLAPRNTTLLISNQLLFSLFVLGKFLKEKLLFLAGSSIPWMSCRKEASSPRTLFVRMEFGFVTYERTLLKAKSGRNAPCVQNHTQDQSHERRGIAGIRTEMFLLLLMDNASRISPAFLPKLRVSTQHLFFAFSKILVAFRFNCLFFSFVQ